MPMDYSTEVDFSVFEEITVTDVATPLNANNLTLLNGRVCESIVCNVRAADVRYRMDGGDPTANTGVLAPANTTFTIRGRGNVARFKAIRTATTNAILGVHYGYP